jgi:hypothetical protein
MAPDHGWSAHMCRRCMARTADMDDGLGGESCAVERQMGREAAPLHSSSACRPSPKVLVKDRQGRRRLAGGVDETAARLVGVVANGP